MSHAPQGRQGHQGHQGHQRKAERTRDQRLRILEAAAAAIAEHGYHGMSMRNLARAATTSLANLYNYYPSKEAILFVLQKEAFETLCDAAAGALEGVAEPDARLYVFISHHVHYVTQHPEVMRVLVHEAATLPPGERRTVRGLKERYFQIGRDILRDLLAGGCGEEGALGSAGTSEAELDRLTYNVFGMLNWIYGWYDPQIHGGPHELARTIHRLVLCGVVAHCPFRELQDRLDAHLESVASPPLLGPSSNGGPSS